MAYPPADPATGFTNDTDQEDSHPDSHNELAVAIIDIVAELGADPKDVAASLTARLSALDTTVAGKADEAGAVMDGDAATGDLSGTYPNPAVVDDSHAHTAATVALDLDELGDVSAAAPSNDDVLQWTGAAWVNAAVAAGTNGFENQDYEKTGSYVYVGYEKGGTDWYVYRRTLSGNVREYASGGSDYATNWAGRAGLSYA